jgi:hypothetical protein
MPDRWLKQVKSGRSELPTNGEITKTTEIQIYDRRFSIRKRIKERSENHVHGKRFKECAHGK